MENKHIHIISFNVPFPPDYGGLIDVFYKIKCLHESGIKIHLHCFTYDRPPAKELEKYCEEVNYYPRNTSWWNQLNLQPYIIHSRRDDALLKNLQKAPFPILFEGLHTTYYLGHPALKSSYKVVRIHNTEHTYYRKLAAAEKRLWKQGFLYLESFKLRLAENKLRLADMNLTISPNDQKRFEKAGISSRLILPFHSQKEIKISNGNGKYLLFHGNLSVAENIKALAFLIEQVFSEIDFPVIIAGKSPVPLLKKLSDKYEHICMVSSPSEEKMKQLISEAHANVLVTFQMTGIKLKLIESLFCGRFCVVNNEMVDGTGLEGLCEIGNTAGELIIKIKQCLSSTFDESKIREREELLQPYHTMVNVKKMIPLIYSS